MKAYRAKTRMRVDQRGRSTNEFADARMRAGNSPPPGPWIWYTRELLESAAMRGLGINERRVLDRIILEHMTHGGHKNGFLIVTHDDFKKWGVRRADISGAIANVEKAGLIVITFKDPRAGAKPRCRCLPSTFALAWLPWWKPNQSEDSQAEPTFHDRREKWVRVPTMADRDSD